MDTEFNRLIGVIFVVLVLGVISASFQAGDPDYLIDTEYGPDEYIRGWINISITNEPTNSFFETSEGDRIKLLDMLDLNEFSLDSSYTCSPVDCGTDHTVEGSGMDTTKFTLDEGNSTVFGLKISGIGGVSSINEFSMDLISDAPLLVEPQLVIDILNDDSVEWQPYIGSGGWANWEDYGCYTGNGLCTGSFNAQCSDNQEQGPCNTALLCFWNNSAGAGGECQELPCDTWNNDKFQCGASGCTWQRTGDLARITDREYCEKITLSPSPQVKIGANFIAASGGGGNENFTMTIYDIEEEWTEYYCDIELNDGGIHSCTPESFVVGKEKDYSVCVHTDNQDRKYGLDFERDQPCGYSGDPSDTYTIDFEIFVIPGTYKKLKDEGVMVINSTEVNKAGIYFGTIEDYILSHIGSKYGGDCSTECIIPIKFTSNVAQIITISNVELHYSTDIDGFTNFIYNLTEIPAKVSSTKFLTFDLDIANFPVSSSYGEDSFALYLGGSQIFGEDITIEKVPEIESLTPTKTASGYPTEFTVEVDSPDDDARMVEFEWDFGNNDTDQTDTYSVIYTYDSIGLYDLKVTVTDSNQLSSSKTFKVNVSSPENIIDETLDRAQTSLETIRTQINGFDSFTKNLVQSLINVDALNTELTRLQRAFTTANTEEEYNIIIQSLVDLNIPSSIYSNNVADSLIFYPKESEVNLNVLKAIGGDDYSSSKKDQYINAIFTWNQENLDTKITVDKISARYQYNTEALFDIFTVKMTEQDEFDENPYFILKKLDDLEFKENYQERDKQEYVYIPLTDFPQTIAFSTTEDITFFDLPLFISPGISELSLGDITGNGNGGEADTGWKSSIIVLIVILIVLVAIATYMILQTLGKKKPKRHPYGIRGPPRKKERLSERIADKILGKPEKKMGHMYDNKYPPKHRGY